MGVEFRSQCFQVWKQQDRGDRAVGDVATDGEGDRRKRSQHARRQEHRAPHRTSQKSAQDPGQHISTVLTGKIDERLAVHAISDPIVPRLCTDGQIEVDCRPIPVEHNPFETSAPVVDCNPGQVSRQRFAHTGKPVRRRDIQVFQKQAFLSLSSRVIVKIHGKPGRLAVDHGNDRPYVGVRAKHARSDRFDGCRYLVARLLILSQFLDEAMDEQAVIDMGRPDQNVAVSVEVHVTLLLPESAKPVMSSVGACSKARAGTTIITALHQCVYDGQSGLHRR